LPDDSERAALMFDASLLALGAETLARCARAGLRLAAAESCTGGLISACLTEIPGASSVLDRGFVVYDDRAKTEVLGVAPELLARCGAVSAETARAMAQGVLQRAPVDLSVAVTGIAGPGGGTANKPVGLVWFAAARRGRVLADASEVFPGDRHAIRLAAVARALRLLQQVLD
jgi:nicotinamide-nucleotide amidase